MESTGGARALVVVQLTGGNDSMNCVVPYGNPAYYDHRVAVRIPEEDVLPIDDQFGFGPALAGFKRLYDRGCLALLYGIGYPDPDYSHFRSLDVWYSCDLAGDASSGWLGKAVRELDPLGENVLTAVNMGHGLPRALALEGVPVACVAGLDGSGFLTQLHGVPERQSSAELFGAMYDDERAADFETSIGRFGRDEPIGSVLAYMGKTGLDAIKGQQILRQAMGGYKSGPCYPKNRLADSLRAVAQMLFAGIGTRVFYVEYGGFDTHSNQLKVQGRLWEHVVSALGAFLDDLGEHGMAEDVAILLWSEFGRRAQDNGSGTDHGAGSTAFVLGGSIKGGAYGEYPSLRRSDLTLGNLRHTMDFRSVYSTILERWLAVDPHPVVGGSFEQLEFL